MLNRRNKIIISLSLVVAIVVLSIGLRGQCGTTGLPVVTGSEISVESNVGGVLRTPDGVEISVPRNAAPSDTTITVQKLSQDAEQMGQFADGTTFGDVWEVISSAGPYFEDLITIKLPYDENDIPAGLTEDDIFPIYLYEGHWYPLPATVDSQENVIVYESLTNNGGIGMAGSVPWDRNRVPAIPGVTTVEEARAMLEKCESDLQSVQERFDVLPDNDTADALKVIAQHGLSHFGYKGLEIFWEKASGRLLQGKAAAVKTKAGIVAIKFFSLVGTVILIKWMVDDLSGEHAPREAWDLKVALARYQMARANLYLLENEDERFLPHNWSFQISEIHESLRQWGMGFDDIWTYKLLGEAEVVQSEYTAVIAAGGYHTVGRRSDGTVVAVGDNDDGQCDVDGWTDITQIAAGFVHTVGLKADGTVTAVGSNDGGQGDVGGWTSIIQVAAGDYHTVGTKADGTVVAVGWNDDGQCDVDGWTNIIQVAAGRYHTVGLKSDGTVVAVGESYDGQCDVGDWTDIIQVATGNDHTVGLRSDGTVVAVGDRLSDYGACDVGGWTDIIQVTAGISNTFGLRSDGTVVAVGYCLGGRCDVDGWTNIIHIAASRHHTVGLRSDGTVVAVGLYDYGQYNVGGWDLN